MTTRILGLVCRLVTRHSLAVIAAAVVLTVLLYSNIRNLRMGTDLTSLFGAKDSQWRAVSDFSQKLGYGNQLFVVIETQSEGEQETEQMEALADRLTADMRGSGLFKFAKCGLQEEELLGMVRLFAWNFPSFVQPAQWKDLRARLSESQIRDAIQRASAGLVTPFSSLGTNYFVTDPLGLMEFAAEGGRRFTDLANFDLEWGSGNRFFSKDHKALLVVSEPEISTVDYRSAEQVVQWTRDRLGALAAEEDFKNSSVRSTIAGAPVYGEQDHKFLREDISRVSLVSIIGNLALCLLVYPRLPLLLMSLLPTGLGILWTTGIISYYPGEVNLISLSFIAILAGLGDDQIVHFFNRVPQEWASRGSLAEAMTTTFQTTGRSILFCILTVGTATGALAFSRFKALAEFGLVLSVGLLMLLIHTLFTAPALLCLWWKMAPPRAPESVTFRFVPSVARALIGFAASHARVVVAVSGAVFLAALFSLAAVRMGKKIEIIRADDNPAVVGQKRLAERFGIGGTPEVFLIEGGEQEVLRKAEGLALALEPFRDRGVVKSIFSPSQMVPSWETQRRRAHCLDGIDLARAAEALERSLAANGFHLAPFQPAIDRLRELGRSGAQPLSLQEAGKYLPQGLLDNSLRSIGDNRYMAAVAFYASDPDATDPIPVATIRSWRQQFGSFAEFSFLKINRDLQAQILSDSRRALLLTAAGIVLIVFLCFRDLRMTVLVLLPIVFAIAVTFGLLVLAKHPFSFMAITALPLIIGIGIDNGIHLVRRYVESGGQDILGIAKASGAALVQSNLTTMIGFGALTVSRFEPLAELGLVTAIGVGMALLGALWIIPATILVLGPKAPAAAPP